MEGEHCVVDAEYEPLRHLMRGFPLEDSLPVVWQLSRHVSGYGDHGISGCPFPDLRTKIFPFQLSLLCRELLLNGTLRGEGRNLSRWQDLAAAVNAIMAFSDKVSGVTQDTFQLELHRIGQQQLPSQRRFSVSKFMRYVLLYEHAAVAPMFEKALEMSAREYSILGFVTYTQFSKGPRFVTNLDLTRLGVRDSSRDKFFDRMSGHFSLARASLDDARRFDHTWQYTFNFLDDKPLVSLDSLHPERVYCPEPERAMARFTDGIFYLLLGQPEFGNAFGCAFEGYAGRVIERACSSGHIVVDRERPFFVGKKINHGADFILSDATGNVFVECKTKRLALRGRVAASQNDLDEELDVLAGAVVQNYRNIRLALHGQTHWKKNALPSMNLVVTLADWNLLSPQAWFDLHARIEEQLERKGLSGIQSEVPYAIVSVEAFEEFCCAINSSSINDVTGPVFSARGGEWQLGGQVQSRYPEAVRISEQLFRDEFADYGRGIIGGSP
ncbi:hypothetical protein OKW43_004886 [Paraburkholderia sp. WC7.3g]|uniref:PD-(D/E)XK nuclease superfamily protein n=1 Tax=Paraburkholderia podalyriae TaxID=1938811 RepID=A0ABR7PJE9_9BURK|nr:hypothetical protein [Paraburkholderia podalyriae]MBC8745914.1 hypothetical protein [Paraburkholderia podalyriae]